MNTWTDIDKTRQCPKVSKTVNGQTRTNTLRYVRMSVLMKPHIDKEITWQELLRERGNIVTREMLENL